MLFKAWDTMLAAALLQPDLYKGLNSVASLYLDIKRWKHLSEEDPEFYNAMDAFATAIIRERQIEDLKLTNQLRLFEDVIMPGSMVFTRMTRRGARTDTNRRAEWVAQLTVQVEEALENWLDLTDGVNPRSSKDVINFLYGRLNLPIKRSKYGTYTADITALRELRASAATSTEIEIIDALIAYREASKLLSTYANYPLDIDDCVHPSFLPAAKDDEDEAHGKGLAGTWRPTSREPNMQNQPMEARGIYIPHKGMGFINADFKQIELRIIAEVSGDEGLKEALKGDPFAELVARLGVDRTRVKNVVYGTSYGAGPKKLAMVLRGKGYNTTERETRAIQEEFWRLYPRVRRWRDIVAEKVSRTYMVENPFGLRRYFYQGRGSIPAAVNFIPQSTTAMVVWHNLVPLENALQAVGGYPTLTVHDSFLMEYPLGKLDEAMAAIKPVLECVWPQIGPGFRVPVEYRVGGENVSWKDLKEYGAPV